MTPRRHSPSRLGTYSKRHQREGIEYPAAPLDYDEDIVVADEQEVFGELPPADGIVDDEVEW